jgi:prolyl-tRNA synthetase
VHTPGQKTIEDVARFLGVSPKHTIKTLAMMITEKDAKTGQEPGPFGPVVVLMRGDHQMNEAKLSTAVTGKETRPMQEDEIRALFHSPAGYLGRSASSGRKTCRIQASRSCWSIRRSKDAPT